MRRWKKRYNKKRRLMTLISIFLIISVSFLSIGYSAFQSIMEVSDTLVMVRLQKDIRVTDISVYSTEYEAVSNWEDYNTKNISGSIDLPNENSEIVYRVEVTNIGNVEMGLFDITGLPTGLKYTISPENYVLRDPICDDNNSSNCKLGIEKNLYIKISYDQNGYDGINTEFSFNLEFDFKRIYSISYIGFSSDSSLPKKVIEGDSKTITFDNVSSIPVDVFIDGSTYSYSSPNLVLTNVTGDILVYKKYNITYILDDGIQADDQVTSISINESTPVLEPYKEGFMFLGWYDNSDFEGEPIYMLSNITHDITLYALWDEYDYFVKIATFDGTVDNVKETDMLLYSEENVNRNFQLKFKIEDYDPSYEIASNITATTGPTLFSSMAEVGPVYPGFAFRLASTGNPAESKFNLKINDSHVDNYSGYYNLGNDINVEIIRENGKMYTKINSNDYTMVLDYGGNIDTSDIPLIIGGHINEKGEYDRCFRGTITDISVEFYEGTLLNKILTYKETKTSKSYSLDGTIRFDGTNYIDTGINLFSPENINKNFDISLTVDQIGANTSQATLINLKDESQTNVWPGAAYRYKSNKSIELTARWPGEANVSIEDKTAVPKTVRISRKNGVIYYSINNGAEKKLISVPPSSLTKLVNSSLTFGSSLDAAGNPFRYFNGVVSDINVILHDS